MSQLPTDKRVEALIELYEETEARLLIMIERAINSGALATELNRKRQLLLVRQMLRKVQRQGKFLGRSIIKQAYEEGLVIADSDSRTSAKLSSVHEDAIKVLVENLTSKLDEAVSTLGRRVNDVFRREALREAAIQLAQGGTRREATDKMTEALVKEGKTAFIDKAGRSWGLEQYVSMAIRTTTREATTQATLNRFVERGIDLVGISSHPTACDLCKPLQGRTYSISGKSKRFPQIKVFPPFHPNCRHTLVSAAENFEDFEEKVKNASTLEELEESLA